MVGRLIFGNISANAIGPILTAANQRDAKAKSLMLRTVTGFANRQFIAKQG